MACEDLLQLLARVEAVDMKQAKVMRLSMLATAESLASGEIVPGDPEFTATAAHGEAMALEVIRGAAESVAVFARKAAEYDAATPGGEEAVVADSMRRRAASAAALTALAEEFGAFMRRTGALPAPDVIPSDSDNSEDSSSEVALAAAGRRPRRRNAKYFGPEWAN